MLLCMLHVCLQCNYRYNRLVAQNATSLTRRFTRLHGLQPLLLTELAAMDTARKACLTELNQLALRCGNVTPGFVDQVRECQLDCAAPTLSCAVQQHLNCCYRQLCAELSFPGFTISYMRCNTTQGRLSTIQTNLLSDIVIAAPHATLSTSLHGSTHAPTIIAQEHIVSCSFY